MPKIKRHVIGIKENKMSGVIKEGKISKTYHMENWLSALNQLRAK